MKCCILNILLLSSTNQRILGLSYSTGRRHNTLVKVLHAASNFKTTEDIHLKFDIYVSGHNLRSLSKTHNSDIDFEWIMALCELRKFLVLHASNFKSSKDIHLKFNWCLRDCNWRSLSKAHNSDMDFDLIMVFCELRKFLVEVLHATSVFKITECIHLKFNTWRSLSKTRNSNKFDGIMDLCELKKIPG